MNATIEIVLSDSVIAQIAERVKESLVSSEPVATNEEPVEFMQVKDVARMLNVSKPIVYDLINRGRMTGIKLGSGKTSWRIKRSEFERFVNEGGRTE